MDTYIILFDVEGIDVEGTSIFRAMISVPEDSWQVVFVSP